MYGTTMKNFNVNKSSSSRDEKKSLFGKKSNKENKKTRKEEDTRYMKLESTREMTSADAAEQQKESEVGFSRKDFPIPSVICTVLFTMLLLVLGSGLLGL
ncbi:MAG: hypothetical protein J6C61_04430 [Clostridia bacterium]|nr:hypothetical protein [Clostridia bacterium]